MIIKIKSIIKYKIIINLNNLFIYDKINYLLFYLYYIIFIN